MQTTELANAYDNLLAAAGAITESTPLTADERSDANWTLSHVALSDRLLAAAAREVLAGKSVLIDNFPAMDPATISSLIASTTHAQRIDAVRRNGAEFLELVGRTPEQAGETSVRLRIFGRDGRHVSDTQLPWGELIRLRARVHVPGHAARLAAVAKNRASSGATG